MTDKELTEYPPDFMDALSFYYAADYLEHKEIIDSFLTGLVTKEEYERHVDD